MALDIDMGYPLSKPRLKRAKEGEETAKPRCHRVFGSYYDLFDRGAKR